MIQKPPICSLVSANGPSVVTTWPPLDRTTVAVAAGSRPPANTQTLAFWSSLLSVSTSLYASLQLLFGQRRARSPARYGYTASRYCVMTVSLRWDRPSRSSCW